ncbi:MAG: 3-keto-disaccharide hydrolase [Bacteroidota bacterium]
MKNFLSFLMVVAFLLAVSCTGGQKQSDDSAEADEKQATVEEKAGPNELTQAEQDEGWMLLFDGETSEGWRGVNKDHFPAGWEVVDGTLHCKESGQGEAGAEDGGDILYDQKFSNFILKFDWKISEGGNSGVFYLGQEVEGDPIWQTAPEFQVLDNEKHPDAMLGENGNRKAASLYDLIPADPQNTKPAGEWNSAEILVYDGTVVHKQNGETVLEYHLWTDDWNELVADSKFPDLNPDWANVAKEGYIALQDHGDDVWYKNIKIREM